MIEQLKDVVDESAPNDPLPQTASPSEKSSTENIDQSWHEEMPPELSLGDLFRGWQGLLVMVGGVIIPSILFGFFLLFCFSRITVVCFDHPFETIAELLLLVNLPLAIYHAWSDLSKGNNNYSLWRGVSLGASIGTSLILAVLLISLTVALSSSQEIGASTIFLSFPCLLACAAGLSLVKRVRQTRDFDSSRSRITVITILGIFVSLFTVFAAEAKPWLIRTSEIKAVSSVASEKREALQTLRAINPARELMIECSDERAAGLSGLFMPLSNRSLRDLFFAVTGEPFDFRDIHNNDLASISDESLARQVVGAELPGLSLLRSSMSGKIHPETLSSTISWTFVFKNDNASQTEARAELAIPANAVATKFTVWNKGQAEDASFKGSLEKGTRIANLNESFNGASDRVALAMRNLSNGRVLISCSGIPTQGELKVRFTAVVPLKPEAAKSASIALPRFIATNFALSGEHQLRLRSTLPMSCALGKVAQSTTASGDHLLHGQLTAGDLTNATLSVTSDRPENPPPVVVMDKMRPSSTPTYISQQVETLAATIPKHLVIVIDGSRAVDKHRQEIADGLKRLPKSIATSVIIASANVTDEPLSLSKAIETIAKTDFAGGQGNLKAVVKAAELGGDSEGGAVLWIHGPQSATDREIYIMTQYESKPAFYDLPIESGTTDNNEFFKNYNEIGPFDEVLGDASAGAAMTRLGDKWRPGAVEYKVVMRNESSGKSTLAKGGETEKEIIALGAHEECLKDLLAKDPTKAIETAVSHNILTAVTAASIVVLPENTDDLLAPAIAAQTMEAHSAPSSEGSYSSGVNTFGTVRVNNLANLEAIFNLLANLGELLGIIGGACLIWSSFWTNKKEGEEPRSFNSQMRVFLAGIAAIVAGLATPGMINWFVASARNANLFS